MRLSSVSTSAINVQVLIIEVSVFDQLPWSVAGDKLSTGAAGTDLCSAT